MISCRFPNELVNFKSFLKLFDTYIKPLEDKFLVLLGSQQTYINSLVINYVNKCYETRTMHRE